MPEFSPKIDISIVTYNSSKWLAMFMKSLVEQEYPLNKINIYITDNGSSDDTVSVLQKYKERYESRVASFNIFEADNRGFGAGHNNNFKYCSSDFILVTNVDLEYERDSISKIIEFALTDNDSVASWELRQKPYEHPKKYNPITLKVNWSSSACVLFRHKALKQINGYDEKIFMYGEDVDISYRLRDAGYVLKYVPMATVWHYAYEYANQIKPVQFFGSIEINALLRIRFGSPKKVLGGFRNLFKIFWAPKYFPNQKSAMLKTIMNIILKVPYFLSTRKKSDIVFSFIGGDYEKQRLGAFYEYKKDFCLDGPRVSVITRTYGERCELLKQSIDSVARQTYRNIELIVVEDGTENAREVVENISPAKIARVKYIHINKAGRCVAGNTGLEYATGKYCIFLDDDDAFYPEHIEVLLNEAENGDFCAAYSNAYEVPTDITSLNPLQYEEGEYKPSHAQKFSRIILWNHNYIPIQSILFRRELFIEYGGFDPKLDNLEDWDLWRRYSLKNNFVYVDKTTSIFRTPKNSDTSYERQQVLDSYYHKVCEKNEQLSLGEMTVGEVYNMAMELSDNNNVIVISNANIRRLKSFIKSNRFLYKSALFCKRVLGLP